jgi:hypothetical protein
MFRPLRAFFVVNSKGVIFYNESVVLIYVTNCIHIIFLFWRFFRRCMYVADTILYYFVTSLQY